MKANIEELDTNPVPSPVTPIYSFPKFHTSKFQMEKKEVCMSENMTLCLHVCYLCCFNTYLCSE